MYDTIFNQFYWEEKSTIYHIFELLSFILNWVSYEIKRFLGLYRYLKKKQKTRKNDFENKIITIFNKKII